jgi:hypothetical protein
LIPKFLRKCKYILFRLFLLGKAYTYLRNTMSDCVPPRYPCPVPFPRPRVKAVSIGTQDGINKMIEAMYRKIKELEAKLQDACENHACLEKALSQSEEARAEALSQAEADQANLRSWAEAYRVDLLSQAEASMAKLTLALELAYREMDSYIGANNALDIANAELFSKNKAHEEALATLTKENEALTKKNEALTKENEVFKASLLLSITAHQNANERHDSVHAEYLKSSRPCMDDDAPEAKPDPTPEAKPEPKPETKPEPKPAPKPVAVSNTTPKADDENSNAALDMKTPFDGVLGPKWDYGNPAKTLAEFLYGGMSDLSDSSKVCKGECAGESEESITNWHQPLDCGETVWTKNQKHGTVLRLSHTATCPKNTSNGLGDLVILAYCLLALLVQRETLTTYFGEVLAYCLPVLSKVTKSHIKQTTETFRANLRSQLSIVNKWERSNAMIYVGEDGTTTGVNIPKDIVIALKRFYGYSFDNLTTMKEEPDHGRRGKGKGGRGGNGGRGKDKGGRGNGNGERPA